MQAARTKQEWRREIAARRRARTDAQRTADAHALAHRLLQLPEVAGAATVAAYASFPSEPGTVPLRTALLDRGVRVLLPVVQDDRDLDWIEDTGVAVTATGSPAVAASGSLGVAAVADVDVVVCPATAVDAVGTRLGRGGGSYDRALARVPSATPVVALLFDDEVVDRLPCRPYDQPVGVVVTPTRTVRRRQAR